MSRKLNSSTPAATAMMTTVAMKLLGSAASSGVRLSNMSGSLRGCRGDDFEGVRADDGHHLHARPGGEVVPVGDGLVLDGAVLQHQCDLAGAGAAAGDLEVDGA